MSRPIQKISIRKYSDLLTNLKTEFVWPFFSLNLGGVLPNPKNPYQKKLRWSKKGKGGLSFLTKSKKNSIFMPPLREPGELFDFQRWWKETNLDCAHLCTADQSPVTNSWIGDFLASILRRRQQWWQIQRMIYKKPKSVGDWFFKNWFCGSVI